MVSAVKLKRRARQAGEPEEFPEEEAEEESSEEEE